MGWLSGWAKRVIITPDTDVMGARTIARPVIRICSSAGATDIDLTPIFDDLGDNYKKIAITKGDGTTQIFAEVEIWDSSSEEALIHVAYSTAYGDKLYLYYDPAQSDNSYYIGKIADIRSSWLYNFSPFSGHALANHYSQTPVSGSASILDSSFSAQTDVTDQDLIPYDGGACLFSRVAGKLGSSSAIDFGSANSYADNAVDGLPYSVLHNAYALLLDVLFKINSWPSSSDSDDYGVPQSHVQGEVGILAGKYRWQLFVSEDGRIYFARHTNSGQLVWRSASGTLDLDNWHSLTCGTYSPPYSGPAAWMYLDGEEVTLTLYDESGAPHTSWRADTNHTFECPNGLDCTIDELRVTNDSSILSNRALRADHAATVYSIFWDTFLTYEFDTASLTDSAGANDSLDALVNEEVREHPAGAGDTASAQVDYYPSDSDTAGANDVVMGGFEFSAAADTDIAGAGDSAEYNLEVPAALSDGSGAGDSAEALSYNALLALLPTAKIKYVAVLTGANDGLDDLIIPCEKIMIEYKQII